MPPLPLLVALMMAFALGDQFPGAAGARLDVGAKLLDAAASVFLAASTSLGIGLGLASSIRRSGGRHRASLRVHSILSGVVSVMNLCVYAWILFGLGWVGVVRDGLGLKDWFILDEVVILLPYILAELAAWFGLFPAARALALGRSELGVVRYLGLRFRTTFGLVLPSMLAFTLAGDLIDRFIGVELSKAWWVELIRVAVVGIFVLTLSPFFVRLALPTRPLEPGPLRDQLLRQTRRLRFKTTNILVWETHGAVVNAVVTGLFPWYRYVLLTDGLIQRIHPCEIAGIYGHEIGHTRHRHFLIFGLFMVGSMGVLALVFRPLELYFEPFVQSFLPEAFALGTLYVLQTILMAAYFYFVFGGLSRMLERQADVFGCRAVSCDGAICPPHGDLDLDESLGEEADRVCPVGVRIFVEGLHRVGMLNGMDPRRFSWRHGSIATRIRFLESLVDDPTAEARFERSVRLQLTLLFSMMGMAFVVAIATGSIEMIAKI